MSRPLRTPTRREFLALGAALVFGPHGRSRDARLTARPHPPFLEPQRGASRIGEDLPRGAILYVPESYRSDRPAPLIVTLHGGSGNVGRWSSLYGECESRGMVLLAPESRARTWDRMSGDFGPDVAFIDAALRYVFDRCAIDASHIALAGFSDGASYALSLGPPNGDLFTHLIAWSPGLSDPEDPIVGRPEIFVSHGTEDQVLSYAVTSGALVPMLEMDGYEVSFVSFEGRHELKPEIVTQALDWFLV